MNVEVPNDKFKQKALYDLKSDKSVVIQSADEGSVVVVWDREDHIK